MADEAKKKNKKICIMKTSEIEERIKVKAGGERSKYLSELKTEFARRKETKA